MNDWQSILTSLSQIALTSSNLFRVKLASSNDERIKLVLCDDFVVKQLSQFIRQHRGKGRFHKDNALAKDYRVEGDRFTKGELSAKRGHELYNLSILYAESANDNEDSARAFAGRAAITIARGKIEGSMADLDRALSNKSKPSDPLWMCSVLSMKAYLCAVTNQNEKAIEILHNAQSTYENSPAFNSPDGLKLKNAMKAQLEASQKSGIELNPPYGVPVCKTFCPTFKSTLASVESDLVLEAESEFVEASDFPNASECLSVRKTAVKGRHVVAVKDIEPGQLLFIEEPFAAVCLPNKAHPYCHHCFKKAPNFIPCPKCAEGCYCSEECLKASSDYHRWECGVGLSLCYSIGIAHLGVRVALLGLTNPNSYSHVKTLLDHIDEMHPEDLYEYTLTAALIVLYLEESNFFRETGLNKESFGGFVLLHIAQLITNGHALTTTSLANEVGREVRIGTGIYPSISMMNHSCDPSVFHSFLGKKLSVRAIKKIKKGEEVFNCYGPHYRRMSTKDRQEVLSGQYFFKCNCPPCRSSVDFFEESNKVRCVHCSGKICWEEKLCDDCGEHVPGSVVEQLLRADQLLESAQKRILTHRLNPNKKGSAKNQEKAVEELHEASKLYSKYYSENSIKILTCKSELLHAVESSKQDFDGASKCIAGAKTLYGAFSIEYANEIYRFIKIWSRDIQESPKSLSSPFRTHSKEIWSLAADAQQIIYASCGPNMKYVRLLACMVQMCADSSNQVTPADIKKMRLKLINMKKA